MIKRVEIERFKKFNNNKIELRPYELSIVVGGNNSGKSSLLQALALWNYAKSLIVFFKGRDALDSTSRKEGSGISFDDFTPLNIPSFDYLWTNLSTTGGYTLKIKVFWDDQGIEKYLQIAFSLVQDRLYAKKFDSNLLTNDKVPEVAYLPPFAGITEKEPWLSVADRRKQIGRGLSGSVLRNLIYDYYNRYSEAIGKLKGVVAKRKQAEEKKLIFEQSEFGRINSILAEVFSVQLFPEDFSQDFHNYLRVPLKKGTWSSGDFQVLSTYSARDIMAEGRGFLQWLSTLCLLFDTRIDVLLLDEPDAHLHATLQMELIKQLESVIQANRKQILIATHSSEVIKSVPPAKIMNVEAHPAYCTTESQVQKILVGIGVEHFPFLHRVQTHKKVVFVEAKFDEDTVKKLAITLGKPIPDSIVFWPMANKQKERRQVFLHLKEQLTILSALSLEDRDTADVATTSRDLRDRSTNDITEQIGGKTSAFYARKWRRWELENYLIDPSAIAQVANVPVQNILDDLATEFSIVWPKDFRQSDRTNMNAPLFDRDGKTIIEWFESKYGISKIDLVSNIGRASIPEDIETLIDQILLL